MNIKEINFQDYKDKFENQSLTNAISKYVEFAKNFWNAQLMFLGVFRDDKLQAVLSLFKRKEKGLNIIEGAIKTYTEVIYFDDIDINFSEIIKFIKNNYKFDVLDLSICPIINKKKVNLENFTQNTSAYVSDIKDIKNSDDILKTKVNKKTRNQIKKSYEYNLEKEISRDIEKFYPLYVNSIKRLGAKPKSKKYFEELKNSFQDNFHILFCKKDGRAVGANLFIINNNYLSLLFSVSEKDYWKYYVNNYMYWEMIKIGSEKGIKWFDFGVNAKRDEAQIHFKEGFGAEAHPIYHIMILNSFRAYVKIYLRKARFALKLIFKI